MPFFFAFEEPALLALYDEIASSRVRPFSAIFHSFLLSAFVPPPTPALAFDIGRLHNDGIFSSRIFWDSAVPLFLCQRYFLTLDASQGAVTGFLDDRYHFTVAAPELEKAPETSVTSLYVRP